MHRPCQGQDLRRLTHLGANAGHRCRQHHHIGAQSGFYLGAHQNAAQSATLTEKLNAARKVATQAAFAPIYSANLQCQSTAPIQGAKKRDTRIAARLGSESVFQPRRQPESPGEVAAR